MIADWLWTVPLYLFGLAILLKILELIASILNSKNKKLSRR